MRDCQQVDVIYITVQKNVGRNFWLKTDALSANLVCLPRSWLAGDMYLFASQIFWAEILDWKLDSWGARQWIRGDITVTGCHRETPPTCWIAALCENVKINLTEQNCCAVSYVHALYTRLLWQNNWLLYPSNYWNTQYTIYTLYTLQQYLVDALHAASAWPPIMAPVPTNYKALPIFSTSSAFFTFSNTFPTFFSSGAQSGRLSDDAWNFPPGSILWVRSKKLIATEKVVDRIGIKMGIIFGLEGESDKVECPFIFCSQWKCPALQIPLDVTYSAGFNCIHAVPVL